MHEDKEKNLVTATFELPGLKKEDISIDVHNNVLTVSGETKASEERTENGYVVKERRYGKFSRSLPVPEGIKVCAVWSREGGGGDVLTHGVSIARGDQGCARERRADGDVPAHHA